MLSYFNSTADGGYDIANCIWPGYRTVFSPHFPALARLLRERHIPAVDLGGFVPGGRQDFDVNRGVPSQSFLDQGRVIMNPVDAPEDALYLGLDMGEQDVRSVDDKSLHHCAAPPTKLSPPSPPQNKLGGSQWCNWLSFNGNPDKGHALVIC